MHFISLFFLNKRNITTFLLMIHLKCTVVHYVNLNSSSINKPFLNYGPLNMLFCFSFQFLVCVYFNETFVKKDMNNYHFLIQISKIHICSILQTLREVCKYGVFSGPYFPAFSPDPGKYGPEKNPYLNTFYAVR